MNYDTPVTAREMRDSVRIYRDPTTPREKRIEIAQWWAWQHIPSDHAALFRASDIERAETKEAIYAAFNEAWEALTPEQRTDWIENHVKPQLRAAGVDVEALTP